MLKPSIKTLPRHQQQAGFTLIEVLIAFFILSIGLLGLAGLQTTGLKSNHSAYLQTQASIYANDIIERMRANRSSALDADYDIADTATTPTSNSSSSISDQDLTEWRTLVSTLPSGTSSVTNNSGQVTVVISWDDSHALLRGANGDVTRTLTLISEL